MLQEGQQRSVRAQHLREVLGRAGTYHVVEHVQQRDAHVALALALLVGEQRALVEARGQLGKEGVGAGLGVEESAAVRGERWSARQEGLEGGDDHVKLDARLGEQGEELADVGGLDEYHFDLLRVGFHFILLC